MGWGGESEMMGVLAFLCRLLVFEMLSMLSTVAARGYELSIFGRLLVSTVQVLIFGAFWLLFNAVTFLLVALQERRKYGNMEEQQEYDLEVHGRDLSGDALQEATGLTEEELAQTLEEEMAHSTTTHATERSRTIVFTSRKALRDHVLHVYSLGVILWVSIYCLDFTLMSVGFFMVVGMYCAWCLGLVWRPGAAMVSSCVQAAYVLLLAAVLTAYWQTHHETLAPEGHPLSRETIVSVVVPVVVGAVWMQLPARDLVRSMGDSFFTCVLLCLPVVASAGLEPLRILWEDASSWVLLWLFGVEPLLKALAVYVIALTLQTGRRAEMLVTLALAVQLDDILFFEAPHVLRVVTLMLMAVCCVTHLFCLVAAEAM